MYVIMEGSQIEMAKIKLADLPDKTESVKLFTS